MVDAFVRLEPSSWTDIHLKPFAHSRCFHPTTPQSYFRALRLFPCLCLRRPDTFCFLSTPSETEVLLDAKHLVSLALPPSQDDGDQNDRQTGPLQGESHSESHSPNATAESGSPTQTTTSSSQPPEVASGIPDTTNDANASGTGKRNSHSSDRMPNTSMVWEEIDAPAAGDRRGGVAHREPYVSLDGLVFLLAELYMKVPQDIIEKVG